MVGENPDAQDEQAEEEEEENEEEDDAGGEDAADANNGAQGEELGQESQASSCVEETNSACLSTNVGDMALIPGPGAMIPHATTKPVHHSY